MAWIEDLAAVPAFGHLRHTRAIGWLDAEHPYRRGEVSQALRERIAVLFEINSADREQVCPLCTSWLGDRALLVPSGDGVFVASPQLRHFIAKHGYGPPRAFLDAVLACPLPNSPEMRSALRALGALDYDEDAAPLVVLEGIAPVRVRPGMYIGDTGARGLGTLVFEVFANALDLNLAARATRIDVGIDAEGWVTVEDDGDGLPLEATFKGYPAFTAIFSSLHFTPTLDGHHPHLHVRPGLAGVGVAVVQALSQRFEVETVRDGVLHRAVFEQGQLTDPLTALGVTTRRGTRIRYLPDPVVFGEARHDLPALTKLFEPLGYLLPDLKLTWQGHLLQQPEGLAAWVRQLAPNAVPETVLSVQGEANEVEVELALCWDATQAERRLVSFVNCAATELNGSHAEGLLEAIGRTAPTEALARRAIAGLTAVVHVWLLHPRFRGPTKAALEVETARLAVRDVVVRALTASPWWWDRVAEREAQAKRRTR